MKRDDSVFFFTLIDFLVASLFFGLVLFAVQQKEAEAADRAKAMSASEMKRLRAATGVSDLTELTDRLTRLGPVRDVERAVAAVAAAGGALQVERAVETVKAAGGPDSVLARIERLKAKEGAGLPHCLKDNAGAAVPVATLVATDSNLTMLSKTPAMDDVLKKIGARYEDVRVLPFPQFRRVFLRLKEVTPECRYTVYFQERTRYVYARDAISGIFYPRFQRQ